MFDRTKSSMGSDGLHIRKCRDSRLRRSSWSEERISDSPAKDLCLLPTTAKLSLQIAFFHLTACKKEEGLDIWVEMIFTDGR